MKQLKQYLLQKLTHHIQSKKLLKLNQTSFDANQHQKFPSIRCLKSSSRLEKSNQSFESPSRNSSYKHSLGELSANELSNRASKNFKTLNEMAHDKIVQSFQQDEYSYILESNNSSPSRISPHKGFPTLGLSNFSLQPSSNRFSPQLSQKITQEQYLSTIVETQQHQMRSSLQNSKTSAMYNSNMNSIILEVEEESNYELVQGSSLKSDIIDLSFSQNNQQTAEVREIQDIHNGTKYFGEVVNGIKQGKGKMFYCDGGFYEGEWKDNQIFGFGRLFYPSNKLAYAGYWKDGCFHGPGLVLNEQIQQTQSFDFTDFSNLGRFWISYRGNFNMDVREGFGVVKISNGDSIAGNWEYNSLNGEAEYKRHDGSIIKGIWKMNRLQKILDQQIKS